MHDVFGLDPKFLSDLQEKNRPTIEQIFPDLKINEAKSNFIEADIDTTLLSDLHMMIRSKGEVYSQQSDASSSEEEQINQLDGENHTIKENTAIDNIEQKSNFKSQKIDKKNKDFDE